MKIRDRYQVQNNQNNHCARGARLMDNFFQSGRRPIKVYIFGKLSSRAFQKYILLWVYDHSEESYPVMAVLMLVISKITSYFDTDPGKVDQKKK
jgi:hypothetical protein